MEALEGTRLREVRLQGNAQECSDHQRGIDPMEPSPRFDLKTSVCHLTTLPTTDDGQVVLSATQVLLTVHAEQVPLIPILSSVVMASIPDGAVMPPGAEHPRCPLGDDVTELQ